VLEASLVADMVKLISLNYVLFHDIKIVPDALNSNGDWRTLRAQIDTKLFQYLHRAERAVYKSLHKIIFSELRSLDEGRSLPSLLSAVDAGKNSRHASKLFREPQTGDLYS
jgi:hypothetical protein